MDHYYHSLLIHTLEQYNMLETPRVLAFSDIN